MEVVNGFYMVNPDWINFGITYAMEGEKDVRIGVRIADPETNKEMARFVVPNELILEFVDFLHQHKEELWKS
jgi:hypothetical protein